MLLTSLFHGRQGFFYNLTASCQYSPKLGGGPNFPPYPVGILPSILKHFHCLITNEHVSNISRHYWVSLILKWEVSGISIFGGRNPFFIRSIFEKRVTFSTISWQLLKTDRPFL